MKNLKSFFLISILTLSGCFSPDSVTRNIRVIAQAEVDGKIVEGSSVMAVRWQARGDGGVQRLHKTEAVILELNDEHTIFLLDATVFPSGDHNISYWSVYVGNALGFQRSVSTKDFDLIENASGRYPVLASTSRTKTMPVMVSFEDETKRETMYRVTSENFSQKLGQNTKFVGVWFEFTDDTVTEMIEKRLPLMFQKKVNPSYREKYPSRDADGKRIPVQKHEFPRLFGKIAFKQEGF